MTPPALPQPPHSRGRTIGRVAGAPLILQPVWFVVVAVLTAFLVPLVQRVVPGIATAWTVGIAAAFVVVFFLSVLLHEVAHALVARRLGQRVHEVVISALGGHTAFSRSGLGPGGSALIAVAGPVVNLVLGGLLLLGSRPLLDSVSATGRPAGVLLATMAGANLLVAAFNLIPGLPLDGGQLLASAVWRLTGDEHRGTVVAAWIGRVLAVGLVGWVLVRAVARGEPPDLFSVAWTLMIAFVVWQGASSALSQSRTQSRADRLSVASAGRSAVGVPDTVSVAQVAAAFASGAEVVVLVGAGGEPSGVVDPQALAAVPGAQHGTVPAWSVAQRLAPGSVVDADAQGRTLLTSLVRAFQVQPVAVAVRSGQVAAVLYDREVARHLAP